MRKTSPSQQVERVRWRSAVLLALFALGAAALESRILYLQLVNKEFLAAQANDRHLRTVEISAHRGSLTDRDGEPLAVSTPVDTIVGNPRELNDALDRIGELADATGQDEDSLARKITSNLGRDFVYLQRHLSPAKAEQIMALGLPGVSAVREYQRYYPEGEVAGHPLGFTDIDDRGQEGLEAEFDQWLRGENGSKRVLQDRLGRVIGEVELIAEARSGRDLRTSIDLRLQYLAYRELKAMVTDTHARSGTAVVLDPNTGEVLAMVNQPSYNPNDRSQYAAERVRNRAITDIFEPGSSFKPLVMAAAIESGGFKPTTIVDTSPGFLRINDRLITQDDQNLGKIPLITVLARSSDVGAARVALTMEPQEIWRVLAGFGIGRLTDSGYPGESAGRLNDPQHWRQIGQATLAYGYGVAVTPLQLARAYSAIAADGVLRPVSMLALDRPPAGTRVISSSTAHALTQMMEAVVSPAGTGKRAAVRNYRVAGKTGTAQKAVVGGHSDSRHTAFFAGFAPATHPRLVVVVVIDEPQGAAYYGADVAAPVFSNIVSGALRVLAVPPDALPAAPLTVVAQAQVLR
ncbi:MAG TPA: penicillin-binding transpeptidase domain-containing protein [Gammaproteobacteria bacterium]|nr:penicillin-binding transpeptidase domain-containing protein [Gammaproteobacteria bacterium]